MARAQARNLLQPLFGPSWESFEERRDLDSVVSDLSGNFTEHCKEHHHGRPGTCTVYARKDGSGERPPEMYLVCTLCALDRAPPSMHRVKKPSALLLQECKPHPGRGVAVSFGATGLACEHDAFGSGHEEGVPEGAYRKSCADCWVSSSENSWPFEGTAVLRCGACRRILGQGLPISASLHHLECGSGELVNVDGKVRCGGDSVMSA